MFIECGSDRLLLAFEFCLDILQDKLHAILYYINIFIVVYCKLKIKVIGSENLILILVVWMQFINNNYINFYLSHKCNVTILLSCNILFS